MKRLNDLKQYSNSKSKNKVNLNNYNNNINELPKENIKNFRNKSEKKY